MSTTEEIKTPPAEKTGDSSADSAPKKPSRTSSSRRKKGRASQRTYDHIPIIIFLLVMFSFTLFCIGIGLTRYLGPEGAGIPACGKTPCPSPFASMASQKGGGE